MIGPVSTTGRAMMSSLQTAVNNGMPVDQAIAYVKSMANDGVAPLVDLYAMMKQFERLKQPPAQMTATPSIRDQLNNLEQVMGRSPQPAQQMQGIPAAGMAPQMAQGAPAAMAQGLGGLDAGTMENPGFAGGGIVAFSDGSKKAVGSDSFTPDFYTKMDPKNLTQAAIREAALKEITDPEKYVQTEKERLRREAEAEAMGEYAPSFEMERKLREKDIEDAGKLAAEEAGFDEEEYQGDVGQYASERGATLLSSLAKAQKGKAQRKRITAAKVKSAARAAEQAKIDNAKALELIKQGRVNEARALLEKTQGIVQSKTEEIAKDRATEASRDAAMRRAIKIRRDTMPAAEVLAQKLGNTPRYIVDKAGNKVPNPEWLDTFNDYRALYTGKRGPSQLELSKLRAAQRALSQARDKATKIDDEGNKSINENDPNVIARKRELEQIQAELDDQGILPGRPGAGGATTRLPSGGGAGMSDISDEELRAELGLTGAD